MAQSRKRKMDQLIKQGLDSCYMVHRHEHLGYEEGICSGLRTMEENGEPAEQCKKCRLCYLNEDE